MEIKNCEQYVVSLLLELENKVVVQKDLIKVQEDRIKDLEEQLEFVGKLIYIKRAYDWSDENPSTYIDIKTMWNRHNPVEYNRLVKIFNLREDSDDEEEV